MFLRSSLFLKLAIFFSVFFMLLFHLFPQTLKPRKCQEYTKEFSGGNHSFKGIDYFIEICNIGMYENADFLLLSVYDSNRNDLLIQRKFTDNLYAQSIFKIKFFDNGFKYYNASDLTKVQYDEIFVEVPPNWWEKFKANHMNPN